MAHLCIEHPYEHAEGLCQRCGAPYCSDCLLYPFGPAKPPYCVPCAVKAGGVRRTAGNRMRVEPKETKRRLKEWRKARRRDLDSPPPDGVATWQRMDQAAVGDVEAAAAARATAESEALRLPPPEPETPTPPAGVNLAPPGPPGDDWRDEIGASQEPLLGHHSADDGPLPDMGPPTAAVAESVGVDIGFGAPDTGVATEPTPPRTDDGFGGFREPPTFEEMPKPYAPPPPFVLPTETASAPAPVYEPPPPAFEPVAFEPEPTPVEPVAFEPEQPDPFEPDPFEPVAFEPGTDPLAAITTPAPTFEPTFEPEPFEPVAAIATPGPAFEPTFEPEPVGAAVTFEPPADPLSSFGSVAEETFTPPRGSRVRRRPAATAPGRTSPRPAATAPGRTSPRPAATAPGSTSPRPAATAPGSTSRRPPATATGRPSRRPPATAARTPAPLSGRPPRPASPPPRSTTRRTSTRRRCWPGSPPCAPRRTRSARASRSPRGARRASPPGRCH